MAAVLLIAVLAALLAGGYRLMDQVDRFVEGDSEKPESALKAPAPPRPGPLPPRDSSAAG